MTRIPKLVFDTRAVNINTIGTRDVAPVFSIPADIVRKLKAGQTTIIEDPLPVVAPVSLSSTRAYICLLYTSDAADD